MNLETRKKTGRKWICFCPFHTFLKTNGCMHCSGELETSSYNNIEIPHSLILSCLLVVGICPPLWSRRLTDKLLARGAMFCRSWPHRPPLTAPDSTCQRATFLLSVSLFTASEQRSMLNFLIPSLLDTFFSERFVRFLSPWLERQRPGDAFMDYEALDWGYLFGELRSLLVCWWCSREVPGPAENIRGQNCYY